MKRIITGVLALLMGVAVGGSASFHPEGLTWNFGSKSIRFRNSGCAGRGFASNFRSDFRSVKHCIRGFPPVLSGGGSLMFFSAAQSAGEAPMTTVRRKPRTVLFGRCMLNSFQIFMNDMKCDPDPHGCRVFPAESRIILK